jgi:DUF971 family protein
MTLKSKTLKPKSISRPGPGLIKCEWPDGFSATITLEKLREECPCAECKGEDLNKNKKIDVPMMKTFNDGMNELVSLTPVGNYALAAKWGDGHNTGYYTWEDLRSIFEEHDISKK